jgi:hypothetical protein
MTEGGASVTNVPGVGGIEMARASRMSVLKRKRESEKAEKAARKREMRDMEREVGEKKEPHSGEASQDDLEAYGMVPPEPEEEEEV